MSGGAERGGRGGGETGKEEEKIEGGGSRTGVRGLPEEEHEGPLPLEEECEQRDAHLQPDASGEVSLLIRVGWACRIARARGSGDASLSLAGRTTETRQSSAAKNEHWKLLLMLCCASSRLASL